MHASAYFPMEREVMHLPMEGESIHVLMPTLRSLSSTQSVHKTAEASDEFPQTKRLLSQYYNLDDTLMLHQVRGQL